MLNPWVEVHDREIYSLLFEAVWATLGAFGLDSHRIALSDARVLSIDNGEAELAYKDYRDGLNKVMTLTLDELLRRFPLHVLPKGFMRIRHFGFLANRCRRQCLTQIGTSIEAK